LDQIRCHSTIWWVVRLRRLRAMHVTLILADPANANTVALKALLAQLEEAAGAGAVCVGNDLETFKAFGRLEEVEVVVPVVFAGGNPAILKELWPLCPKVRWVHSMAAGVDTLVPILKELPRGSEVPLTNAKGAFSRSLAEYAIAALLHFNKQVPRLQSNRASKTWDRFTMGELYGQTAGFIGFGDIAQNTAKLCKAFGMRVVAFRNTRGRSGDDLADEVYYASENADAKKEVFRNSDFVICSLPGGEQTFHACGAAEFAAMKPSAVFVSMGRGSCVDEAALIEVLRGRNIAGAALDVFEKEPLAQDSPLWECENLLLSPHNADLTAEYMRLTWDLFMGKFKEFADPKFQGFSSTVDFSKGY